MATLAFGAIGFADDYLKVVHRRNLGLTARAKLGYQFLAAFAVGAILSALETHGLYSTRLIVPFLKHFRPDLVISRLHHGYLVAAGVSAVSSRSWPSSSSAPAMR